MRGIIKYLMLLLIGMVTGSCVSDSDQVIPDGEQRNVMFTVSLDGPQTRAPWSEEYPSEEGVPFDFRINPDGLRVVVMDAGNTRLGTLEDLYYFPIDEAHTQYQFIGQMPEGFVEHFNANGATEPDYKFMVLTNCGDNLSGEQYITYGSSQLDPAAEDSSIPMWGVIQADLSSLLANQSLDIGEIWLLRAAAKVEVKLSERLKGQGVSIVSSTLKYYNQTGYSLPEGWQQVTDTRNLDQENSIRLYRHAAMNLPFVKDEQTGDYYIYVCEYDNHNYPEERNKISLEFKMGSEEDSEVKAFADAISFCNYSGGSPVEDSHYNIVRNHIYEFEILSIAGDNILIEYTVADWAVEDWDGSGKEYEEHDLDYPTYHNPVVPVEFRGLSATEQLDYKITDKPQMYYTGTDNEEAGAFKCLFQILAPTGVQWKPGFMGSKADYQIRVYHDKNVGGTITPELVFDSGVDNMQSNLNECSPGEWFRIVIFPLNNEGEGQTEIDFGISYYQEWTDQYINLYVNGEYDNIRWPESGDNPKVITIKHVADPEAIQSDE